MSNRNNKKAHRREGMTAQSGSGQIGPVGTGTKSIIAAADENNPMMQAALSYRSMGLAVIPLKHPSEPNQKSPGKEPKTDHGLKDATTDAATIKRWWRMWPDANIGIVCGKVSGGLVALDLDNHGGPDGADTLHDWESEHGELPETARALTGGGGVHILYRSDKLIKKSENHQLAVDVRGEGSYFVAPPSIHESGRRYEWEYDPAETPIATATPDVLAFIDYVRPSTGKPAEVAADGVTASRFELPQTIGKGGRNSTLFSYGSSLAANWHSDADIAEKMREANATRCKPPLDDSEVETLIKQACKLPKGPNSGKSKRNRDADHLAICKKLISRYGAVMVGGVPVLTAGGPLRNGWDALERAAYKVDPKMKQHTWRECKRWMFVNAPEKQAAPSNYVAFKNGVLDINTMVLHDECPQGVVPVVIPHDWIANPPSVPIVETILNGFANGYAATRDNLEEVMGECITRGGDYRYIHFFQGPGGNGKSTFFDLLEWTVGPANCKAMDPHGIGAKFQPAELAGALVNIADDIGVARISEQDCMLLKSASLGGLVDGQMKGEQKHAQFHPFVTFLFACNDQPALADTTEGMRRRVRITPATARFTDTDGGGSAAMLEAIHTEATAQYALWLAVNARRRVLASNGMTPNDRAQYLKGELMRDSDPVLAFIDDAGLTRDGLAGTCTKVVYDDYDEWCEELGYPKDGRLARQPFTRRVCSRMDLRTERKRFNDGSRGFVYTYPPK